MRRGIIHALASLLILLLVVVEAAEGQLSSKDLPACGVKCLQSLPPGRCAPLDVACRCGNKKELLASLPCLVEQCTMADSLLVRKVQADICGYPDTDKSSMLKSATFTLDSIAAALVILRLVHKRYLKSKWAWDDVLIGACLPLLAVDIYSTIAMIKFGLGKHIHQTVDGDLFSFLQYLFITITFYIFALGLVKLSVLFFYLRLFPYERFRKVVFVSIGYVVVTTLLGAFFSIFQCKPVENFWNKDIEGQCLNLTAMSYIHSAFTISSDVLVLVLPLPVIATLNLGRKKKIGVMLMFALGSFDLIIAIARLRSLVYYGATPDPTYDLVMALLWSGIEVPISIICACFPALRRFFVHVVPGFSPTTNASSNENEYDESSQSWYTLKSLRKDSLAKIGLGKPRGFIEPMVLQTHNLDFPQEEQGKGVQHNVQETWYESRAV